jgi:hypothetical protein
MDTPEPNLSDLVIRIDTAIAEGREAELLAEHDLPVGQKDQLDAARDDLIRGLLQKPVVNPGGPRLCRATWLAATRDYHGWRSLAARPGAHLSTQPHGRAAGARAPGIVATRPGGMRRMHPPTRGARAPELCWLRNK